MPRFHFQLISKVAANWSHQGPASITVPRMVSLEFRAVQDEMFGPATPYGELRTTVTEAAASFFTVGSSYILDFTPNFVVQA